MLPSFTAYKKPLTKEDEKEEFNELYQLLQSMVKPSVTPLSAPPVEVKSEIIEPVMIKEIVYESLPSELKVLKSESPGIIKDDIALEGELTTSPDVFEIYKYIRPRGRPKGSKTNTDKKKVEKKSTEKRKYVKKEKIEKTEKKKYNPVEADQGDVSDENIEHIPHPIEMPKSMKPPQARIPIYPNGVTCKCCLESFPKNTDYLLHLNTSDICMKVLVQPLYCQPRHELTKPLHMIMYEWLSSSLTDGKDHLTCRHCHLTFKSIGNMNKHLYTSITCNRMAYIEFKKIVSDY